MKREVRVGRKAGRTSWRMVRYGQRGRDGQGWPGDTWRAQARKSEGRGKFEDAREVLVGSTQDEDVGGLSGGHTGEAGGEGGQLRSRHCSTIAFVLR